MTIPKLIVVIDNDSRTQDWYKLIKILTLDKKAFHKRNS